jgi:hypothetical protein
MWTINDHLLRVAVMLLQTSVYVTLPVIVLWHAVRDLVLGDAAND